MSREALLLMVLVILISVILLIKPYSISWGYGPSDSLIVVLALLLILVVAQGKPLIGAKYRQSQDSPASLPSLGSNLQDLFRGKSEISHNPY